PRGVQVARERARVSRRQLSFLTNDSRLFLGQIGFTQLPPTLMDLPAASSDAAIADGSLPCRPCF
ncbi:MAG: hypothetical protein ACRDL7_11905, partial [Gaiellaceae bacterium]